MQQRRRFKQISSLGERFAEEAKRLREKAKALPPGPTGHHPPQSPAVRDRLTHERVAAIAGIAVSRLGFKTEIETGSALPL